MRLVSTGVVAADSTRCWAKEVTWPNAEAAASGAETVDPVDGSVSDRALDAAARTWAAGACQGGRRVWSVGGGCEAAVVVVAVCGGSVRVRAGMAVGEELGASPRIPCVRTVGAFDPTQAT
jgi:hypothetical protein